MPSITFWSRLEPFTRLADVDAGLQARTHDALWLLARQWQTGEFQGEDGATPVQAQTRFERVALARLFAGPLPAGGVAAGERYTGELPLEAVVEREPVQVAGDPRRDRRLAAEAGLMFLRLLERAGVSPAARALYAREPGYALAADGDDTEDTAGDEYLAIMSGRVPDGFRIHAALRRSAQPPRPELSAADAPKAVAAGQAFVAWLDARYSVPRGDAAPTWIPERMEYAFAVSAMAGGGEVVLTAREYTGGTLDWNDFDIDVNARLGATPDDPRPEFVTHTVMPAPVRYPGIAADRWWQFEDGAVNLGRIEADPDELLRMLLVDFSLLYSNDWFVLPIELLPGALFKLRSLVVTDAFGQRTLVPHHSAKSSADWRMFAVSPTDDLLFLPPVLASSLHGDPIEEVVLLRDELSNLVWAIEARAPSVAGGTIDRRNLHRQGDPPPPASPDELNYTLATTVPAHWFPFQPVRNDARRPDVRLRRAAALIDGEDGPALARPLGRILEPDRPELSLFEEEVPSTGVRLVRQYQYARWRDGSTVLWLGRRKSPGAPEGTSGLRFDLLDGA